MKIFFLIHEQCQELFFYHKFLIRKCLMALVVRDSNNNHRIQQHPLKAHGSEIICSANFAPGNWVTFSTISFLIKTSLKTNVQFFFSLPLSLWYKFFITIGFLHIQVNFFPLFFFQFSLLCVFFACNLKTHSLRNNQFVALYIFIVHAKQVFAF